MELLKMFGLVNDINELTQKSFEYKRIKQIEYREFI